MAITKQYWTAEQIIDRVKDEMDLQEETFIDDVELVRYCNAAIDRVEQQVIGIHKDYFLSRGRLTSDGNPVGLVSGVREYKLPANIYAHKIRRVIYENSSQVHKVSRIQDWKKFEELAYSNINDSGNLYNYFLVNDNPGEPRMLFIPTPRETGDYVTVWFLRQANRFDDSYTGTFPSRVLTVPLNDPTNILDIPEAFNYIVEFVKMKCDIKEKRSHGQNQAGDYPEVMMEYKEFIGVIQEIVPDAENLIEADYSAYEDFS